MRPWSKAAAGSRARGPWYDVVEIGHISWRAALVPGLVDFLEHARGNQEEPDVFWLNSDIYRSI